MANLLVCNSAPDLSGSPGRIPLELHVQLRRFHHCVLRGRLADDPADLRFLVDSARRDSGNQRHRCDGAGSFSHVADLITVVVAKPQKERCTAIEISQIRACRQRSSSWQLSLYFRVTPLPENLFGYAVAGPGYGFRAYCAWLALRASAGYRWQVACFEGS